MLKNLLEKKVVFITGVGKGIGKSLLFKSIEQGAFVYGLTKSKKDVSKFNKIKNCKVFFGDTRKIKNVEKIFKLSLIEKRPIDCLINNAGSRQRIKFLNIKKKDLNDIFENNFFSVFNITKLYSSYIIKNKIKASIVNVGSIVGQLGFNELSGYASTKTALIGFTKSFAVEMKNYKTRINLVNPGFIKTSYFKNFKKMNKLYKWTKSRTISGKWGEPDDVSYLICFLLSSYSEYINGQIINIDGGWTAS